VHVFSIFYMRQFTPTLSAICSRYHTFLSLSVSLMYSHSITDIFMICAPFLFNLLVNTILSSYMLLLFLFTSCSLFSISYLVIIEMVLAWLRKIQNSSSVSFIIRWKQYKTFGLCIIQDVWSRLVLCRLVFRRAFCKLLFSVIHVTLLLYSLDGIHGLARLLLCVLFAMVRIVRYYDTWCCFMVTVVGLFWFVFICM
jgi:hypothetical protein